LSISLKASNDPSPGIDGQTKANWKESSFLKLEKDLRSQKYQPKPAKRIYIEKPNNGKRPISIASTRDKVVQMVVKDALEPH
jgi:retron-type reverse transcriptase